MLMKYFQRLFFVRQAVLDLDLVNVNVVFVVENISFQMKSINYLFFDDGDHYLHN